MHYHLILTENCDSQCRYCYEKSMKEFDNELDKKFSFDFSEPEKIQIDLNEIKKLINKKIISEKDFEYEKYFGPEIIP